MTRTLQVREFFKLLLGGFCTTLKSNFDMIVLVLKATGILLLTSRRADLGLYKRYKRLQFCGKQAYLHRLSSM